MHLSWHSRSMCACQTCRSAPVLSLFLSRSVSLSRSLCVCHAPVVALLIPGGGRSRRGAAKVCRVSRSLLRLTGLFQGLQGSFWHAYLRRESSCEGTKSTSTKSTRDVHAASNARFRNALMGYMLSYSDSVGTLAKSREIVRQAPLADRSACSSRICASVSACSSSPCSLLSRLLTLALEGPT